MPSSPARFASDYPRDSLSDNPKEKSRRGTEPMRSISHNTPSSLDHHRCTDVSQDDDDHTKEPYATDWKGSAVNTARARVVLRLSNEVILRRTNIYIQ